MPIVVPNWQIEFEFKVSFRGGRHVGGASSALKRDDRCSADRQVVHGDLLSWSVCEASLGICVQQIH